MSSNRLSPRSRESKILSFLDIPFPKTRYQGSKLRLLNWFFPIFHELNFDTVLDALGGSAAVSHLFKRMEKKVTYNDILTSNYYISKGLIANKSTRFSLKLVPSLFKKKNDFHYSSVIQDQFKDIYYTDEENKLLDTIVQNIFRLENQYEKSLCFFALFQACLQKRPFNIFHRRNLNLRMNNVRRSFGNLKTWNTPFLELFQRAMIEANQAIFDNNRTNTAMNYCIFKVPIPDDGYDLVYLDPPYISEKGVGVDYYSFYHFLEGIIHYYQWEELIDFKTKHRRLKTVPNKWSTVGENLQAFEEVIAKFQDSIIVISYREPGIPSIGELKDILLSYKVSVNVYKKNYKYALTKRHQTVNEILLVAKSNKQ
ncbi:MAG: DNA adenine methylase [Candidatus Hermodarchaeota archaeon]